MTKPDTIHVQPIGALGPKDREEMVDSINSWRREIDKWFYQTMMKIPFDIGCAGEEGVGRYGTWPLGFGKDLVITIEVE